MKDETRTWLLYADENLDVAALSFDHGHLNACLQNAQQAVEKYLKAVIVEHDLEFRRTHGIRELLGFLAAQGITLSVSEDEMDLRLHRLDIRPRLTSVHVDACTGDETRSP